MMITNNFNKNQSINQAKAYENSFKFNGKTIDNQTFEE